MIGCYAFYNADTNEIVYIGSACAKDSSPANIGLRQRLRFYKGRGPSEKPTSTVVKVREYAASYKTLLKCWIVESPGDCRKYEDDAIRFYKPRLNWFGTRELSEQQTKIRKNQWAKNRAERLRKINKQEYNSERIRKCTKCKIDKPCKEFKRNASKLYGVIAVCKKCAKLLKDS
jgi:hypothetical protein